MRDPRPPRRLPRATGVAVFTLAALLAGCQASPVGSTSPTATPAGPTTGGSTTGGSIPSGGTTAPDAIEDAGRDPTPSTPAASPDGDPSTGSPVPGATSPPSWTEVAAGLDEPIALLTDPRTHVDLVVELGGRIVGLDGAVHLDLSDRVERGGERGLLDATITPDGTALIVHYSGTGDGRTVVSRLPVESDPDAGLADPDAEQVLLGLDQPASNHNGGSVVFGPDGLLYVALGDGGRANDAFGNGADPTTPLGAILRLDVTSQPGTVVVPDDNPFVGDPAGDDRVWAHGLRNPWRIATDGEAWFVADVGQDAVEEISIAPATPGPHDFAWPTWEGDRCRVDVCEPQPLPPVATLTHAEGACSIIGMAVASEPAVDAGRALWTDLCDTRVWALDPGTGDVVEDTPLPGNVPALALDVDADGFVVALTTDGRVLRRVRA